MKKLIILFLILNSAFCIHNSCSAQTYQWAHGFGGPNYDSQGSSIATDAQGNVYVTGTFRDSIDFDPGTGTDTLSTGIGGGIASFIAKYDSSGTYIWGKSLNGILGQVEAEKIVVKNTGIYLVGHFFLSIDFDPGPGTALLNSVGGWNGDEDIFIAHYDLNGNYLWAKSMGGLNEEKALDMALDNSNNIYITGYFKDTVDLDPGISTAPFISNGIRDVFFAKYDSSGNYQWAHSIGDSLSCGGNNIIVNNSNEYIYIAGYFNGSPDFDPSFGTYAITSINVDDFIAKYDTSGNYIWAGAISSAFTGGNLISDICVYSDINNEYLLATGSFRNVTDFDITSGVNNISSATTSQDLFIAKYNDSGNLISIETLTPGTSIGPRGENLKVDSIGAIYLTGNFYGTTDFNLGINPANLTSNGNSDIFFAKYDSTAALLWAKGIGGLLADVPKEIAINKSGNQYLTGYFSGTIDCDPGVDTVTLSLSNNQNIFVGKYIDLSSGIFNQLTNNYEHLVIYPNPANDYISIRNGFNKATFSVKIIDMIGQTVLENSSSTQRLTITSLRQGMYIIYITENNKTYNAKFIKQ